MILEEQIDQFLQKNEDEFLSKEHDRSNMPLYVTKLELRILLKDFASQYVQQALAEAENNLPDFLFRSVSDDEIYFSYTQDTPITEEWNEHFKRIKTKYSPITE